MPYLAASVTNNWISNGRTRGNGCRNSEVENIGAGGSGERVRCRSDVMLDRGLASAYSPYPCGSGTDVMWGKGSGFLCVLRDSDVSIYVVVIFQ